MYLQKVIIKQKKRREKNIFCWRHLTKRAGSRSVSQRYGSRYEYQNVSDPERCPLKRIRFALISIFSKCAREGSKMGNFFFTNMS
jgi:hypothetical protein